MDRKLEAAGIVMMAAGLLILVYVDPLLRILLFGTPVFSPSAVSTGSSFPSGAGGAATFSGRSALSAVSADLVPALSAFCAAVVGLVLVVTSALTRDRTGRRPSS